MTRPLKIMVSLVLRGLGSIWRNKRCEEKARNDTSDRTAGMAN
jgi:hypothetical protein